MSGGRLRRAAKPASRLARRDRRKVFAAIDFHFLARDLLRFLVTTEKHVSPGIARNNHEGTNMATVKCHRRPTDLESRLKHLIDAGPCAIENRLGELDREWSVGRVTKVSAAVLIGLGLFLALWLSPWWAILSGLTCLALLQYLISPTSLLGEALHRMGFRSGGEIERERLALRVLRGDFSRLPTLHDVEDRDAVSRFEDEGGPAVEPAEKLDTNEAVKQVMDVTQ